MTKDFVTELKRCVAYDPETGLLTWKDLLSSKSRAIIGGRIGHVDRDGYLRFKFMNRKIYAHIATWIIVTGDFPAKEIDHKDVDPANNRWTNLREATRSQNKANMGPPRTNTSGVKGVRFEADRNKWAARIHQEGSKVKCLGRFTTKEEAAKAYQEAAIAAFGEYARF